MRNLKWLFWVPLLYAMGIVLYVKSYSGADAEDLGILSNALTAWIPMAAFFYPVYMLWDAYDENGGKIHFVYLPYRWQWVLRNGFNIGCYALIAAAAAFLIQLGSLGGVRMPAFIPLLSIVWFYGWMGMFFMTLTKDAIWSTFLNLAIYVLSSVGPMSSWRFFNPHDQMITASLEALNWRGFGVATLWGCIFLVGSGLFVKRRL